MATFVARSREIDKSVYTGIKLRDWISILGLIPVKYYNYDCDGIGKNMIDLGSIGSNIVQVQVLPIVILNSFRMRQK